MRPPHRLHLCKLALITVCLTFLLVVAHVLAQVACETPPGQGKSTAWKRRSHL